MIGRQQRLVGRVRMVSVGLSIAGWMMVGAGCSQFPTRKENKSLAINKPDSKESQLAKMPMARLSEHRGQPKQAQQIYQQLVQQNPNDQIAIHRLGVLAAQEGKFAEAHQHFQRAVQCGEPTVEMYSDVGYALYLEHRLDEAEKVLRDGLKKEPKHRVSIINLGMVLGEQGRFEESLQAFRMAVSEAEAQANLGYIHTQRGEFDQAKARYNQALTLDNNLRVAAIALVQLAQRERVESGLPAYPDPAAGSGSTVAQSTGPIARDGAPAYNGQEPINLVSHEAAPLSAPHAAGQPWQQNLQAAPNRSWNNNNAPHAAQAVPQATLAGQRTGVGQQPAPFSWQPPPQPLYNPPLPSATTDDSFGSGARITGVRASK